MTAPPFDPVDIDADAVVERYVEHRREGLTRFAALLRNRMSPAPAAAFDHALASLGETPANGRSVFLHPHYGHWWNRLSLLLREADRAGLDAWAPQFARFTRPAADSRPLIPGTAIEVDATDPWTGEFLDGLNVTDPPPGMTTGTMRPGTVGERDLALLREHLDTIGGAWPEMLREIEQYVRLIVPIEDPRRDAFTCTAWPAAIFVRPVFDRQVYTVERLVHETSHLRLNLVGDLVPLHRHGWDDTVPSPFRAGPRPVTGLYHGAFVFTRAAVAMDRIVRHGSDPGGAFARRIPYLVGPVEQALTTIGQRVRLTDAGAGLLDLVRTHVADLGARYGSVHATGDERYIDF